MVIMPPSCICQKLLPEVIICNISDVFSLFAPLCVSLSSSLALRVTRQTAFHFASLTVSSSSAASCCTLLTVCRVSTG